MSAAQPWMKFHPQDWRADEKLRLCSLAARGLWIEMLAIMHRSERYGHLLIGGVAPTDAQLAVQAGASPHEVSELIGQLESAGVFSRSAGGTIYSRRMTRDRKKADLARKNGKNGGNPKLCNQTDIPASDKGQDKPPDKGSLKLRGQRPEKKASPKKPLADDWEPAPFKSGKSKAIVEGWSTDQHETEVAKFKAHHRKMGNQWASWQDAWETWVLNSVGFAASRQSGNGGGSFLEHLIEKRQREEAMEASRKLGTAAT